MPGDVVGDRVELGKRSRDIGSTKTSRMPPQVSPTEKASSSLIAVALQPGRPSRQRRWRVRTPRPRRIHRRPTRSRCRPAPPPSTLPPVAAPTGTSAPPCRRRGSTRLPDGQQLGQHSRTQPNVGSIRDTGSASGLFGRGTARLCARRGQNSACQTPEFDARRAIHKELDDPLFAKTAPDSRSHLAACGWRAGRWKSSAFSGRRRSR